MANYRDPVTTQPKKSNAGKRDSEDEKSIDKIESKGNFQRITNQFQLDVDIQKSGSKSIWKEYGKSVYEVKWIDRDGPESVLLQIDGAKARKKASFYVQLSSHPHILRTYGLVRSNPDSTMLLQERAPQGILSHLLLAGEFSPNEEVLQEIFKQICDAMVFLVEKNIIHGDLACRNVLVFQMNPIKPQKNLVKITDFGLINVNQLYSMVDISGSSALTIIHTRYAAPELLANLDQSNYSEKSDIYSMGVLMWEACATGQLPYSNITDSERIRQEKLEDKRLPKPSLCNDQLWIIINRCWRIEPERRPNFDSLRELILDLQSQSITNSEREIIPNTDTDSSIIPLQINPIKNFKFEDSEDSTMQEDDLEKSIHKNEQFFSDQASLDSDEVVSPSSVSSTCPFCQEQLPSSKDLHTHLIQCGTKTDQCPNCRQFIQRAVFAYHYENNCTNINDDEISNKAINSCLIQTVPPNFNQKDENSGELVECKLCHNFYTQHQYDFHQDICIRNPANKNNTLQRKTDRSQINNGSSSDTYVLIPCEYCQEPCIKDELQPHQQACPNSPTRMNSTLNNRAQRRGSPNNEIVQDTSERNLSTEDGSACCCCS